LLGSSYLLFIPLVNLLEAALELSFLSRRKRHSVVKVFDAVEDFKAVVLAELEAGG